MSGNNSNKNNNSQCKPKPKYSFKQYFAKPGRYEVDLSLDVNVNHHHTSHAAPNAALGRTISPGPNTLYGQIGSSPSGSSSLSSNGSVAVMEVKNFGPVQSQGPFRTSTPLSWSLSPIVSSPIKIWTP